MVTRPRASVRVALWRGRSPERLAQLALCVLERALLSGRQVFAAAVDLEVQHRHGRAERRRLATVTALGRALQGQRDLAGTGFLEDTGLEVHRVARLHDAGGPFSGGRFGRSSTSRRACGPTAGVT